MERKTKKRKNEPIPTPIIIPNDEKTNTSPFKFLDLSDDVVGYSDYLSSCSSSSSADESGLSAVDKGLKETKIPDVDIMLEESPAPKLTCLSIMKERIGTLPAYYGDKMFKYEDVMLGLEWIPIC